MRAKDEFHTIFGKLYVWLENEDGNLVLHSVEQMERTLAQVAEVVAAKAGSADG